MADFTSPAWSTTAHVTKGVTNVSLRIRYPEGQVVGVGVPHGSVARDFARIMDREDGYTVLGVTIVDGNGTGRYFPR